MKLLSLMIKKNIIALCFIILGFFTPIIPLIIAVGIAIFSDTIFGMYKAKKKGEKINSRRASDGIGKFLLYQSTVITMFCLERLILDDFVKMFTSIPYFLTKIIAIFIIWVEILSIKESFESITGINIVDKVLQLKNLIKRTKEEVKDITA